MDFEIWINYHISRHRALKSPLRSSRRNHRGPHFRGSRSQLFLVQQRYCCCCCWLSNISQDPLLPLEYTRSAPVPYQVSRIDLFLVVHNKPRNFEPPVVVFSAVSALNLASGLCESKPLRLHPTPCTGLGKKRQSTTRPRGSTSQEPARGRRKGKGVCDTRRLRVQIYEWNHDTTRAKSYTQMRSGVSEGLTAIDIRKQIFNVDQLNCTLPLFRASLVSRLGVS